MIMKKLYILTIVLFFTVTCFSQSTEELYGKWEFKDIATTEPTKKPADALKQLFKDMAIDLSDKMVYYGTIMGVNEVGSWELKGDKLELSPRDGEPYSWTIVSRKDDELSLEFKSATIVMVRVGDSKIVQQ